MKLAAWISEPRCIRGRNIVESEVAVDAEIEVGGEAEVRADSPFDHYADGQSDPWPTSSTPRAGHVIW